MRDAVIEITGNYTLDPGPQKTFGITHDGTIVDLAAHGENISDLLSRWDRQARRRARMARRRRKGW